MENVRNFLHSNAFKWVFYHIFGDDGDGDDGDDALDWLTGLDNNAQVLATSDGGIHTMYHMVPHRINNEIHCKTLLNIAY